MGAPDIFQQRGRCLFLVNIAMPEKGVGRSAQLAAKKGNGSRPDVGTKSRARTKKAQGAMGDLIKMAH